MPPPPRQLDLLEWTPPATTVRFEDGIVRAATLSSTICKAIATVLKTSGKPRAEIATLMGKWLGKPVTKNMLDAYASEARTEHEIPLTRFMALVHATSDRRLLELLAESMGWAVIERRHLPLIELASVQEKQRELACAADALRRQAKQRGGL